MTFPNPAGYYLPLPEAIELEITELDYVELAETLNEITYSLTPTGDTNPRFEHLDPEAADFYSELSAEHRISLVRWIAERLDYLAHGTTNEA